MAKKARKEGRSFKDVLHESESFRRELDSLAASEKTILEDSFKYIGRASEITDTVCDHWENAFSGDD